MVMILQRYVCLRFFWISTVFETPKGPSCMWLGISAFLICLSQCLFLLFLHSSFYVNEVCRRTMFDMTVASHFHKPGMLMFHVFKKCGILCCKTGYGNINAANIETRSHSFLWTFGLLFVSY